MDFNRLFDAKISKDSIDTWRASGKKALGIICCFVPHEILHAADILPVRLRATGCEDYSEAEVWMSSFSCSFAKSILQYFIDGVYELDGLIASDGCMQAVRIFDNWKAYSKKNGKSQFFFELGVPRMRSRLTKEFYREELLELVTAIEEFTGKKITAEKLMRSTALFNEERRLIKQVLELQKQEPPVITGAEALSIMLSSTNMPVEEYIELLKAFLDDAKSRAPVTGHRARLMIIGSALDSPDYIKAIENKGGLIVADTICLGSMAFGDELTLKRDDVIGSIANYYIDRLVCPRMIDGHEELHETILRKAREYRVDGIIYEKMLNCECWGGENLFLEKELKDAGIPLLNVEREQKLSSLAQLEIRAEAFIEMIEKEV
jgi:benzoyl-CoA reductase subunit C